MSLLSQIADQLNLRWAWEKVRREAVPGDLWFDAVEVAEFEIELEANLKKISNEFISGEYHLSSIRPIPFPKHPDAHGKPRVRQVFHISVRDQVAWTAVVNIIGPHVDSKMPTWSYGNRLFRSIWVETDPDGVSRRKIGRYRHSSGRMFLPFGQSWPVFRRHVYLTTRAMTSKGKVENIDEATEEELKLQERLVESYRCPFVLPEYWKDRRKSDVGEENLFWCSVDLEKFYPTISRKKILENIASSLPDELRQEAQVLLESMLDFKIDVIGWSSGDLSRMDIATEGGGFDGLPTGLYVAGFLANAGLLRADLDVAGLLNDRNIAHFRFVDDHVILAYSFDELVAWVAEYSALLANQETGVKVNPQKIEPAPLSEFLEVFSGKKGGKTLREARNRAMAACKLDPKFPSPLMTKTLALVSAIARTDFNLLEVSELGSLTDQLEHMLLVEMPEAEIPEKTRLSFAATRLTKLAECRIANNGRFAELVRRLEMFDSTDPERKVVEEAIRTLEVKEERETHRAFELVRKVLRERPDRVRLWARAIQMCKQTGVKAISEIFEELKNVRETNSLSGEYLVANAFTLLGSLAVIAAGEVADQDVPRWRQRAARSFLEDLCANTQNYSVLKKDHWFVKKSADILLFGIFCAEAIVNSTLGIKDSINFPASVLALGGTQLRYRSKKNDPASWAWWGVRLTLRNADYRAGVLVKKIGLALKPSRKAAAFWSFFPSETPINVLNYLARKSEFNTYEGWWFDALRESDGDVEGLRVFNNSKVKKVLKNIRSDKRKDWVSLYDWCRCIKSIPKKIETDPRVSEWTSLEIIRQISRQIGAKKLFDLNYVLTFQQERRVSDCLHPANFLVPRIWLESKNLTWEQWKALTQKGTIRGQISQVGESIRIEDLRYEPVRYSNLWSTVNPVRGLGLLLYCLLMRSFALPSLWNSPGHADVLSFLPQLLFKNVTCSSWTFGLLQGCLQARATENIFQRHSAFNFFINEDTLQDPVSFLSANEVCEAVKKCQLVLEENQLSTLNHKARQLTPVSIRQLSSPQWIADFSNVNMGVFSDER